MKMIFKPLLLIALTTSVETMLTPVFAEEPSLFEQVARTKDPEAARALSRSHVNKTQLDLMRRSTEKMKRDYDAPPKPHPVQAKNTKSGPVKPGGTKPGGTKPAKEASRSETKPSTSSGPRGTKVDPGDIDELNFSGE